MYLCPNNNNGTFISPVKPYLSAEGGKYNKLLGSFGMHTAFERKGGENVDQKEWVKRDRQEEKQSVREGKEKMVVFTKGKSDDDFCLLLCWTTFLNHEKSQSYLNNSRNSQVERVKWSAGIKLRKRDGSYTYKGKELHIAKGKISNGVFVQASEFVNNGYVLVKPYK